VPGTGFFPFDKSPCFSLCGNTGFLYATVGCGRISKMRRNFKPPERKGGNTRRVFMKNTIKFLGIIALAAIIGFSFTACGDDDDDNSGGGNEWLKQIPANYLNTTWERERSNSSGTSTWTETLTFGSDASKFDYDGPISEGKPFSVSTTVPKVYNVPVETGYSSRAYFTEGSKIFILNFTKDGSKLNMWDGIWETFTKK
jgi:hypothetical protein